MCQLHKWQTGNGRRVKIRTCADVRFGSLSAATGRTLDVRFTPESCRGCRRPARQLRAKSELTQRSKRSLFNQLVGAGEKRVRHLEAQRFGGREIDDELELGWLLDREIAGLRTTQNLVDVVCRAPEPFRVAWSVGHERAGFDKITGTKNCRYPRTECRCENACKVGNHELINRNVECIRSDLEALKGGSDILCSLDYEWHDIETEHACRGLGLPHLAGNCQR